MTTTHGTVHRAASARDVAGLTVPVLGLVTIGQSPRIDLTPDVLPLLGDITAVEHGALDGLSSAELPAVGPEPGESPLVSRLRNGGSVRIGHRALGPLLTDAVARCVADGANAVLILCTGHLGRIPAPVPVLYAEPLAQSGVSGIIGTGRLGVVNPLPDQMEESRTRWTSRLGRPVLGDHADPYTESVAAVAAAAAALARRGAQWVFLDCIGYTEAMRSAAAKASGVPVLLARTLAARLATEAVQATGQG